MKYSVLSSIEYYKGRALLACCKFSFDPDFVRKSLEWVSSKSEGDHLSVLVVSGIGGEVSLSDFNSPIDVSLFIGDLRDLSDLNNLTKFSCIVFQGVSNDKISSVIRKNIENYVMQGGGIVVSEIKVDADYVSIFENIGPIYCTSSEFLLSEGAYTWTDDGKLSYFYDNEFSHIQIAATSTVAEIGLGSYWRKIYIYDTSIQEEEIIIDVVGTVYSSEDYDISGIMFIGYFPAVYKNGIFTIET